MHKIWTATILFALCAVSGGTALATTEPPGSTPDAGAAVVAAASNSFAVWAASEGVPVSRVACSVEEDTVVCYGTAVDQTTVGASAVLVQTPANLTWDRLDGPDVAPTTTVPATAPPTTGPTTAAVTVPAGPFPIAPGATGPTVAAIQGRLGISVDCDYGNQTRRAVEEWQQGAGIPVTGSIDEAAWSLLAVPTTWGIDANANGTIEPDEVTLVCGGDVDLPPPPVDTTGWPNTTLAFVAELCSIPDEFTHPDDEGPDYRYSPSEDTITIFGAGAEDYPERGEQVFDIMICVLGTSGVPDRVVNQISATRALDGMQTASWDDLNAQWTYHPDAGMNLTIWSS